MDADKRTQMAITITRTLLLSMFDDPGAMLEMTFTDVKPEEIEDKVCSILEYIEKTAPENLEAEG